VTYPENFWRVRLVRWSAASASVLAIYRPLPQSFQSTKGSWMPGAAEKNRTLPLHDGSSASPLASFKLSL
jgi:hypothetical protein